MRKKKKAVVADVPNAVEHPMMIRCSKCKEDIRTKDCGCNATWLTEEIHPIT